MLINLNAFTPKSTGFRDFISALLINTGIVCHPLKLRDTNLRKTLLLAEKDRSIAIRLEIILTQALKVLYTREGDNPLNGCYQFLNSLVHLFPIR